MAAIFDWMCDAHGHFEGPVGKCPHGCGAGMVKKVWLKAPGIQTSGKTKFIDKQMNAMAKEFGMTDMSNRGGRSVGENQDGFRWSAEAPSNPMLTGQPFAVKMNGKEGDVSGMMHEVGLKQGQNALAEMKAAGAAPQFKANVVASYTPPKK